MGQGWGLSELGTVPGAGSTQPGARDCTMPTQGLRSHVCDSVRTNAVICPVASESCCGPRWPLTVLLVHDWAQPRILGAAPWVLVMPELQHRALWQALGRDGGWCSAGCGSSGVHGSVHHKPWDSSPLPVIVGFSGHSHCTPWASTTHYASQESRLQNLVNEVSGD